MLAGAAAAGLGIYELTKKPAFQVTALTGAGGVPLKIATPVPDSVNASQASAVSVGAPSGGGSVIVNVQLPNRGQVHAPAKSVQPDASGAPQPTPVLISPTGSSSFSIGSLKDIQRGLNTLGIMPLLKEDGLLGPATIANIKAFQSKSGLTVDGNAGPATKAALSAAISSLASSGSAIASHPAVSAPTPQNTPPAAVTMSNVDIQKNLNILGAKPPLTADGKLGPMSIAAIKSFQASHGLAADGVAGPKTKTAIYIAVHPAS
jgi:peptidoglycan hydrolase-like protein with peptidoglycan-binding domain